MNNYKLITFILLSFLLVACQPSGNVSSSFGTKVPESSGNTSGGNTGNPSANLVSIVNGDKQSVSVGGTAALPLVVLVLQAPGQAVANETVYFQVVGGASRGQLNASSALTNASGYAEVYFSGGSFIGDVNIVASAPQGSVNFTTTVTGATGYSLSKTVSNSGEGQVGNINSALTERFKTVLTDTHGDLVAGQNIRFVSTGPINLDGSIFSSAGGSPAGSRAGSAGGSIFLQATTINLGASHVLHVKGASTSSWSTGYTGYSVGGGAGGIIGFKYLNLNGVPNADTTGGVNWNGITGAFEKHSEDGLVSHSPL